MSCGNQTDPFVLNDPLYIRTKRRVQRWIDRQDWFLAEAALALRTERRIRQRCHEANAEFSSLKHATDLKVHLGCGPDLRNGWINIDLSPKRSRRGAVLEQGRFVNYDLRRGLPLATGSARLIHSSHFFEHLDYEHGVRLMADCHRVLRSDGVFRIVLPDFRKIFRAYLDEDRQFLQGLDAGLATRVDRKTMTSVDYINYAVYQYGEHKFIYDQAKLAKVLQQIGFRSVGESAYSAEVDLDSPERRLYSFYFEARR